MKRMALFLLILSASAAEPQQQRVLLVVFAHPDDETFAGPVLARYAREGVKVYLAIATRGEKGADGRSPIPPGDPLAKARRAEAECACQKLGIEPPIFFDLNDGELGAMTNPLGKNIQAVADNTEKLIAQLHSQVVVTWGPDGGYGHPDHRLVSDAVSQVIQSMPPGVKLYYVGLTPKQAAPLNREWPPPDSMAHHESEFSDRERTVQQGRPGKRPPRTRMPQDAILARGRSETGEGDGRRLGRTGIVSCLVKYSNGTGPLPVACPGLKVLVSEDLTGGFQIGCNP
jgi:LmbE family N-acetylglucosaminyl deacetylase